MQSIWTSAPCRRSSAAVSPDGTGGPASRPNTSSTAPAVRFGAQDTMDTPGRGWPERSKAAGTGGVPARTAAEKAGMPVASRCRCAVASVTDGTSSASEMARAG